MTKQRTTKTTLGVWGRTTQAFGKILAAMVSPYDRHPLAAHDNTYPRFPIF
jgi:hypothetical protein